MQRPVSETLGRLAFLANTRGIIPNPITATRIDKSVEYVQNTTTIVYTVPAGKVLFISSSWLSQYNAAATAQDSSIFTRNGSDVLVVRLLYLSRQTLTADSLSNQYSPAVEVLAGHDVCVYSSGASNYSFGGFSGWLEDA